MRRTMVNAFAVAIASAGAMAQPVAAQGPTAPRVLPQIKSLHLVLTAPGTTVPASCRRYAGAFAGQFAQGPYANVIITNVTTGPQGCIFRGTYAWSGYPANPQPGTTAIGPGEFFDGSLSGADLRLGNPSNIGMVVHPDLRAEFYMQGSLVSRAALAPLSAAALQ